MPNKPDVTEADAFRIAGMAARKVQELTEIIRYWSYCTYQGMRKWCPEKEPEFREMCQKLGIAPYDVPAKAESA